MASEKKSFSELLSEAPLASAEKTVCLTGVLARSNDPGKFMLTMGDNQTITLDVDAVKEHKVLSGMVGQMMVQVEVDRDRVPGSATEAGAAVARPTFPIIDQTAAHLDQHHTVPWDPWYTDVLTDVHKLPIVDVPTNFSEAIGTGQETVVNPGDPGFGQGISPFALATPHQAPQGMFQAAPGITPIGNPGLGGPGGPGSIRTSLLYDLQSIHYLDKPPIADITGRFPYPD
jgi:hypothetical protein